MKNIKNQTVDLLISHGQLLVRSREYNEGLNQWGDGNINQGALLHKDYIIFDPLPEDAFGANVNLKTNTSFVIDENCQRCIVTPFCISDKNKLEVASAAEKFKIDIDIDVENGDYAIYYEVCEGEEIYYNFTFIPAANPITPEYLMDDDWGGVKNKKLTLGKF